MKRYVCLLISIVGGLIVLATLLAWASPDVQTAQALSPPITVCVEGPPTCDYSSIQAAVDAAPSGGEIKVAAGTYTDTHSTNGSTQVVYLNKTVSIIGGYTTAFTEPPDPDVNSTILDAGEEGRVVYIEGNISPLLEGLIMMHGDATGLGGGPWAYDGVGGGIYAVTATATIRNCEIIFNVASKTGTGGGGGVYLWNSPSTLEDNYIGVNHATQADGGWGEGGGLGLSSSDATLSDNSIIGNYANGGPAEEAGEFGIGGGIYMEDCQATFQRTILRQNYANYVGPGEGGGVFVGLTDNSRFENTLITLNSSGTTTDSNGSAIAVEYSTPDLLHTTIHDNTGGDGSAIYVYNDGDVTFTNTIVASQTIGALVDMGNIVTFDGVLWYHVITKTTGMGTASVNHEVVDYPRFESDGHHLQADSGAIDAGVPTDVTTDIDGQPRPLGSAPDLGVDEWRLEVEATPGTGATLVYTEGPDSGVVVTVPPGAVVETTTLAYTNLVTPGHPLPQGESFAGLAFDLDALCAPPSYEIYLPLVGRNDVATSLITQRSDSVPVPLRARGESWCADDRVPCTLTFQIPVTFTLTYTDTDVAGLDENTLKLYYWDGSQWEDAATTCTPMSTYDRDPPNNTVEVAICHLSRFAIGGH